MYINAIEFHLLKNALATGDIRSALEACEIQ